MGGRQSKPTEPAKIPLDVQMQKAKPSATAHATSRIAADTTSTTGRLADPPARVVSGRMRNIVPVVPTATTATPKKMTTSGNLDEYLKVSAELRAVVSRTEAAVEGCNTCNKILQDNFTEYRQNDGTFVVITPADAQAAMDSIASYCLMFLHVSTCIGSALLNLWNRRNCSIHSLAGRQAVSQQFVGLSTTLADEAEALLVFLTSLNLATPGSWTDRWRRIKEFVLRYVWTSKLVALYDAQYGEVSARIGSTDRSDEFDQVCSFVERQLVEAVRMCDVTVVVGVKETIADLCTPKNKESA